MIFEILIVLLTITIIFCIVYKQKYKIKIYDDPILQKIYNDLKLVYPDLDNKKIKLYGANDTLTENKKIIYLCVKRKNNEYYDYNTILYIAIHELAHVLNDEYDTSSYHGEKFQKINEYLLKRAVNLGIFDPNKEINYDMCGTI